MYFNIEMIKRKDKYNDANMIPFFIQNGYLRTTHTKF